MTSTRIRRSNALPRTPGAILLLLGLLAIWAPAHAEAAQDHSLRLERVNAYENPNLDIDEVDDKRVDADIAVFDTGIDLEHEDLNVVEGVNCLEATAPSYTCSTTNPGDGDDAQGPYHGTLVSANIAAIDNTIGSEAGAQYGPAQSDVGIAPGARLWAIDVFRDTLYAELTAVGNLKAQGKPWTNPEIDLEPVIAGVKWVTAHASQIEVVHLGVLCYTDPPADQAFFVCDEEEAEALEAEIAKAVDAGIVVLGAYGRGPVDPDAFFPAGNEDMILITPIVDKDGIPGAKGGGEDDAGYVDKAGGTDIVSPDPGGAGSGAGPLVVGAAAILASKDNPENQADVEAIRDTLVEYGSFDWTDTSGDKVHEPRLDVFNSYVFNPNDTEPLFTVNSSPEGLPGCPEVSIEDNVVSGGCAVDEMDGELSLGAFVSGQWVNLGTYNADFDLRVDQNGDGYAINPYVYPLGPFLARVACDTASGKVIPWAVDTLSPEDLYEEVEMQITVGIRAGTSGPGGNCTKQVITVQGVQLGYEETELDQGTQSANVKDGHWLSEETLWLSWDG